MTASAWFRDVSAEYGTSPACKSIEEWPCGRQFTGTREALIATGLFRPEWFPGEPGMRRHTSTVTIEGRRITIQKRSARIFRGTLGYTQDESARREANEAQARALAALQEDLAAFPDSGEAYRCQLENAHANLAAFVRAIAVGDRFTGGYSLGPDARLELARHLHAAREVIRKGNVTFDASRRDQALRTVYEAHGQALPRDEAFAQFLAGLSELAGDTPAGT